MTYYNDDYVNRLLFCNPVKFGNNSKYIGFNLDLINRLDSNNKEHLDYLSITVYSIRDIHIKLRVYGKDYDLGYCNSDIYNSICDKEQYVDDVLLKGMYKIYKIEVEDPVELGDWTDSKDKVIRQIYTKKLKNNGDIASFEVSLEIISRN